MKVRVVCYEGYKAEETPRAFLLGERRVEVIRVLEPVAWRGPRIREAGRLRRRPLHPPV